MPAPNRRRGFTLMEVAIAIAVMAILAGTAIPLVLKGVNQAKEQRVRQEMKLLFETCFGAQDRLVPNIRTDWGFDPALPVNGTMNFARYSVRTAGPGSTPPAWNTNGATFRWGWNGPYWNGSTQVIAGNRTPVDPWGKAYLLRWVSGVSPGYQVICTGPNGVANSPSTNAVPQIDDMVYPAVPMAPPPTGQLIVTIKNGKTATPPALPPTVNATFTLTTRVTSGANVVFGALTPAPALLPVAAGSSATRSITNLAPGGMTLQVVDPATGLNVSETIFLAPGETRNLNYTVY